MCFPHHRSSWSVIDSLPSTQIKLRAATRMDPKYGERYRDLFEKHWWWRARTRLIIDVLRRLQPARGWKSILDVGCGDGLFFPQLSQFGEVEGVEPFAELVSPNNPYRSRIQICPFDENFRPGKRYSLILMLDVLEHRRMRLRR